MTRKRVVTCSSWLWSSCSWSASAARCSLHHLVCCPPHFNLVTNTLLVETI
ncbi:hypothetical protein PR002_g116 [Phytophthora rubi]|uniref:Uncharacterized protein n=1 Tax=Phytophthora rubi TaxID=129364 RepID=A0A6A3P5Y2_9STRA|nr:hypothetical protein PR002_g116 [Phytophthora rubi]